MGVRKAHGHESSDRGLHYEERVREMTARRRPVSELVGNDNKDGTSNRVYVILGTSHQIQCRWGNASPRECQLIDELESAIRRSVGTYKVTLIAEEAPHDVSRRHS